jgi:hypothetical protein
VLDDSLNLSLNTPALGILALFDAVTAAHPSPAVAATVALVTLALVKLASVSCFVTLTIGLPVYVNVKFFDVALLNILLTTLAFTDNHANVAPATSAIKAITPTIAPINFFCIQNISSLSIYVHFNSIIYFVF